MSQYSVDELYLLWRDYMEHDMPTGDPVDSYVTRYAHRLGFRRDGSDGKLFSLLRLCFTVLLKSLSFRYT